MKVEAEYKVNITIPFRDLGNNETRLSQYPEYHNHKFFITLPRGARAHDLFFYRKTILPPDGTHECAYCHLILLIPYLLQTEPPPI